MDILSEKISELNKYFSLRHESTTDKWGIYYKYKSVYFRIGTLSGEVLLEIANSLFEAQQNWFEDVDCYYADEEIDTRETQYDVKDLQNWNIENNKTIYIIMNDSEGKMHRKRFGKFRDIINMMQ